MWVRGLPSLFNDSEQAQFLTSSIGLLVLLLYFPGGLMQLAYQLRDAVLGAVDRRMAQGGVPQPIPTMPTRIRSAIVSLARTCPCVPTVGSEVGDCQVAPAGIAQSSLPLHGWGRAGHRRPATPGRD